VAQKYHTMVAVLNVGVACEAQLLFPHVDINLLAVIAHMEQLQFDIGTWVT